MIGAEDALKEREQRLRCVEAQERREARENERCQKTARQGFGGAASPALKPISRCVRSQNGRVFDCPQRQRTNGRLSIGYGLPFQSTTVTSSPSTTRSS